MLAATGSATKIQTKHISHNVFCPKTHTTCLERDFQLGMRESLNMTATTATTANPGMKSLFEV